MRIIQNLIAVIIGLVARIQASGSCSKPGTLHLKENPYYNVKTFSDPLKKVNGTFCNKVWTKEGSCCKMKDASQYATNWLAKVKKNANATRVIMPIFKNSLEYIDVIKKYANKNKAALIKKDMKKLEFDDYMGML
jgi:hypothetical protein